MSADAAGVARANCPSTPGQSLLWFETDPAEYQAFRTFAAQIVASLSREDLVADYGQSEHAAVTAFHAVTSNRFQKDWYILDDPKRAGSA